MEGTAAPNHHGGRREDDQGNALGGRPTKAQKLATTAVPIGQLGVFEYMQRSKQKPTSLSVSSGETTTEASASLQSDSLTETESAQTLLAQQSPDLLYPLVSSIRSQISSILSDEVSRLLQGFRGEIESTKCATLSELGAASASAAAEVSGMQRMLKAHSQLSVLNNEHTAVLSTGHVFCATCTENIACITDGRSLRSKFIASNGGVNQDNMLVLRWGEHSDSDMHKCCVEASTLRKNAPMDRAISAIELREKEVMETLFRACAFSNIHKQSFYMYEHNIVFLHSASVDVGTIEHSRATAREMTISLTGFGRQQVRLFITSVNPMTGRKPHFGLAADKLTDLGKIQGQIIMGRLNYAGTPLTIYVKLASLDLQYDVDHEASGLACFNQLCEVKMRNNGHGTCFCLMNDLGIGSRRIRYRTVRSNISQ